MLEKFDGDLSKLIEKIKSFSENEPTDRTSEKQSEFLQQLNLNRSDHQQQRFMNNNLTKIAYEDQISRLTKRWLKPSKMIISVLNLSMQIIRMVSMKYCIIGHFTSFNKDNNPPFRPLFCYNCALGIKRRMDDSRDCFTGLCNGFYGRSHLWNHQRHFCY